MVKRRRRQNTPLVAGIALVFLLAGVWYWHRSLPWNRARAALNRGDSGQAVEILSVALNQRRWTRDREEVLLTLRAKALFLKGALDLAEGDFRQLHADYPRNFDAALGLGVINLLRDRRAFARDYLETALGIAPRDIRPYLLLVGVYRGLGDSEALAEILRAGWGRFPNDRRLARIQADYDFERGRYDTALRFYDLLRAAAPEDRDLLARIALTHLHAGHHRQAADLLTDLRPENRFDYPLELALAQVLRIQGRRADALSSFASLYNRNNAHVEAGLYWAEALAERGALDEADALLDRLGLQILPLTADLFQPPETMELSSVERLSLLRLVALQQNAGLLVARGRAATRRGKYEMAERAFRQALSLETDSFEAIHGMMELARRKDDNAERLRWADRLVAVYREHPAALLARAEVYLDLGRNPDAAVDARLAANAYPELSRAQALLARAWLLTGKTEEALHAAERAVALNGGDPAAHFAMAEALAKAGDARRTEVSYSRALNLDPFWVTPRVRFARFLTAQGRFSEANQQLTEAARIEGRPIKRDQ
ncbi:MAG: tetratricopeptide repeat protein [Elusimicrobia bacterium]|nr:MAG: tetratricopeptide repeat protein [Elusimicrobiota bacterium]